MLEAKHEPLQLFFYPYEYYEFLKTISTDFDVFLEYMNIDLLVGEVVGLIRLNGSMEKNGGVVVDYAKKLRRYRSNWETTWERMFIMIFMI